MELSLLAPIKFSLSAVIGSHGWASLAPFETNDEKSELRYLARLTTGRVVAFVIRQAGGGIDVDVDEILREGEKEEVKEKVRWMLGLGQDFSEFYALVEDEPKLAQVIKKGQGRILRSFTFFEDTVKTILTTNTSWAGTIRMVDALVTAFGDPLPEDPSRRAFPTSSQLAAVGEEDLRSAGLGYRAPYVRGLASTVVKGELDIEGMKSTEVPTGELHDRLLSIKGVGEYAAASLLMILGRYDYLPVDSWARKMVSEEWYAGEPVGSAEVEEAFEPWGKWKGLAYWFWDWDLT
jgi:3-methyladenine DNA glycosylase/8-oxoguanine DNA glycosylase